MPIKRKVEDPVKFQEYINDFISLCEENNVFPSDYELAKYIGCSCRTIERYRQGNPPYDKYSPAFVTLKKYAEKVLIDQGVSAKNPAFQVFLLKQEKYGGYTDMQQVKQDSTIKIQVAGVGGEDAFK